MFRIGSAVRGVRCPVNSAISLEVAGGRGVAGRREVSVRDEKGRLSDIRFLMLPLVSRRLVCVCVYVGVLHEQEYCMHLLQQLAATEGGKKKGTSSCVFGVFFRRSSLFIDV